MVFTDQWGHPLGPSGVPIRPAAVLPEAKPAAQVAGLGAAIGVTAEPYAGPTGEPLDRWGFHLNSSELEPADVGPHAPPIAPPPPEVTGHRPAVASTNPTAPAGEHPVDPTRAGPAA